MELIADGVLILAALAAMTYCMVLSRRLRRLTELDGGLGAAITALSREVDHLSGALAEAKTATTDSATDLGAQCRAAHIAARRLETLVKSANKTVNSKVAKSAEAMPQRKRPERSTQPPEEVPDEPTPPAAVNPGATLEAGPRTEPDNEPEAKTVVATGEKKAAQKPSRKTETTATPTLPMPDPDNGKPTDSINATALDQFINAIVAKGDAVDNAALARRLVMALADQQDARTS